MGFNSAFKELIVIYIGIKSDIPITGSTISFKTAPRYIAYSNTSYSKFIFQKIVVTFVEGIIFWVRTVEQ